MLPPRPLLAVCLVLLAGLSWHVGRTPPPTVPLADAALWEGQAVTVTGWVATVHPALGSGGTKVDLVDGAAGLTLRVVDPSTVDVGDRLTASGRLTRQSGALVLAVEQPTDLRVESASAAPSPGWAEVSRDPAVWIGRPIVLVGTVAAGKLSQGGTAVALGPGPWPRGGTVSATGTLAYDDTCFCQRFTAREVRPWTP